MRAAGNLVANAGKRVYADVINDYRAQLRESLKDPLKRTSVFNVMQHAFGYCSRKLSANERRFFVETLGLYGEGRIPLTSVLALLQWWAILFQGGYLIAQTLLEPYPRDLIEWSDGGRPIAL